MEDQFPTTKELWKLPTMGPPSDPVFISPAHPPRSSIDPMTPPSTVQQQMDDNAITTPTRGCSNRKDQDKTPTNRQSIQSQEINLVMSPANIETSILPEQLPPATMPQPNAPTLQPFNAKPGFVIPPPMQNSHGLGFHLPLRNRRMTAPVESYYQHPRHMPLSSVPALQSPFVSEHDNSSKPIDSDSFINSGAGYKVRNATDLLEAMQAHPNETFANIRALGNDNHRLTQLKHQMEKQIEEMHEANKRHGEEMTKNLKKVFIFQNCKEYMLHTCISRLENNICLLRGGGKVVRGLWFSDDEFAAANQLVISGESNWDLITEQKSAAQHGSSETLYDGYTAGCEEVEDIKGKGKEKVDEAAEDGKGKEKREPRWNPKAVGLSGPLYQRDINQVQQNFVPSVAGSPGKSDTTEIFSPFVPLAGEAPRPSPAVAIISPYQRSTKRKTPSKKSKKSLFRASSSSICPLIPAETNTSTSPTSESLKPKHIPEAVLSIISESLPRGFRIICPFSLTGLSQCPRNDCTMKKLCKEYNHDANDPEKITAKLALPFHANLNGLSQSHTYSRSSDSDSSFSQPPTKSLGRSLETLPRDNVEGKEIDTGMGMGTNMSKQGETRNTDGQSMVCSNKRCLKIHELATCVWDLSVENGGANDVRRRSGTGPGTCKTRQEGHFETRRHMKSCGRKEWQAREVIAGLREAHREGRYL